MKQEINWDFSAVVSKRDIMGLKSTITENKNNTDFKIAKLKNVLEKPIAKLKSDLEKSIAEMKNPSAVYFGFRYSF